MNVDYWIPVETEEPQGECLVTLEEPMLGQLVWTANYSHNVKTIGSLFHFDCPKVIAWTPKPEPYKKP